MTLMQRPPRDVLMSLAFTFAPAASASPTAVGKLITALEGTRPLDSLPTVTPTPIYAGPGPVALTINAAFACDQSHLSVMWHAGSTACSMRVCVCEPVDPWSGVDVSKW